MQTSGDASLSGEDIMGCSMCSPYSLGLLELLVIVAVVVTTLTDATHLKMDDKLIAVRHAKSTGEEAPISKAY